jgi:hypothetical protein
VFNPILANAPLRCGEIFERSTTMAVTASFLPGAGVLTVFGDNLDNTITTSSNAASNILVNCGAVAIQGAHPRLPTPA